MSKVMQSDRGTWHKNEAHSSTHTDSLEDEHKTELLFSDERQQKETSYKKPRARQNDMGEVASV
jgi:hypothetical protein